MKYWITLAGYDEIDPRIETYHLKSSGFIVVVSHSFSTNIISGKVRTSLIVW
jgi:hypothetical protein